MPLTKRRVVQLTDDSGETRNSWSISFSREGEQVVIGMHWNEKATATHEFRASYDEFVNAIGEIS